MNRICEDFGNPEQLSRMCLSCSLYRPEYWDLCWEKCSKNKNMETKEVKIEIPEGYEIDKEKSTFEKIVFKPIVKRWRDNKNIIKGYYITSLSVISPTGNTTCDYNLPENHNVFATEKQAKSALAMAQISQIMANDERFGGVVTDEEWENVNIIKHIITRLESKHINETVCNISYTFLAFHTEKQRKLFLEENEDLVKQYLMID